jgi:probable HAF family extracellular repeat protein
MLDLGQGTSGDLDAWGDVVVDDVYAAPGVSRSFVWQNGTFTDLGSLGGKYTDAEAINAFRQIVGEAQVATGDFHDFLWQEGAMTDLTGPNGGLGGPVHINNLTEVGATLSPMRGVQHAALWRPGQPVLDLGPQGSTYPFVRAINDVGEIVVTYGLGAAATTVVLGPDGKVLRTLGINVGNAINNAGQLVYTSSQNHAVLLTPVGGKMLTRPETDDALGLIRNLKAEMMAAGQTAQGPAKIALEGVIVPDLGAAERHLDGGFTLGAVGELKAVLRLTGRYVPPEAGVTPERINRVKELITRLGGNPGA